MDCPPKNGRCGEEAISGGSTALVNREVTAFLSDKHASYAVYQT